MTDPRVADDQFERYYTERLWELIPSVYRHEDGIAERPGTLRAFIELIAEQVAVLRRGHDRLWDDAFIDLCDDWAVPYLGDLVGTRMVSALNKRGRRVDVAKTIYYRRRKGTPRVLEELIADLTGWDGKVVESFRFLGRHRHRLDPPLPELLEPARGWADLRSPRLAEQAGGPWDPFAHTADLRRAKGDDGRWNIPRVSFHLFRLGAYRVAGVRPHLRADGATFTFDPSGRDTALFMPRHRGTGYAWDAWHSAQPWEVPAPMGCRVLGHGEYELDAALIAAMATAGTTAPAVAELGRAVGVRFPTEDALHDYLATLGNKVELLASGNFDRIRRLGLVDDCGKAVLWPDAVAVILAPVPPPLVDVPVRTERVSSANLADLTLAPADLDLIVDPVRGRGKLLVPAAMPAAARVRYCYGFGGAVGAGTYDRRATVVEVPDRVVPSGGTLAAAHLPVVATRILGVTELPDSGTYGVAVAPVDIEHLTIQAANLARPYVRLGGDWVFTAAPGLEATLVLDGLWIGARVAARIVLEGAWHQVVIRNTTLDPGGADLDGLTLHPIPIVVAGPVDELRITSSIVARIATSGTGAIDQLVVEDSIVASPGAIAIALTPGLTTLRRVTILGGVDVEQLDASEAIITGHVDVTDTQVGCFRFSAAPPGSRLPHPYRWVPWTGGPAFVSMRFGDAGYLWLAEAATDALRRGGEDGTELGVWNRALNPIKEDSLMRKVEEYLPFGLIPMFIRES